MLGALCYVCVPNIDELTILTFQLELGDFAPGLKPLEFVSGECSSNWGTWQYKDIGVHGNTRHWGTRQYKDIGVHGNTQTLGYIAIQGYWGTWQYTDIGVHSNTRILENTTIQEYLSTQQNKGEWGNIRH